jgi:hypothetical protein
MTPFHWRALLFAAAVFAGVGQAAAQSSYCERLRADIASLDRYANSGRNRALNDQIARQRNDLNRMVARSRDMGCGRQVFLIFGDPAPPECAAIEARINRMEAGLAELDAQAQRGGGPGLDAQRASLLAAYESNCSGVDTAAAPRSATRQPGLLERLFGGASDDAPVDETEPAPVEEPSGPEGIGGTFKTICVRKCDGYYFPISQVSNRARIESDTALCQASCPNAEVELFLQPLGRDADASVSAADGTPYASIPNAYRYRKAVDQSCACRREGQTWVEALGEAERLMGERGDDVVVTEEKSAEMAKPLDPPKPKPQKAQKGKQQPAPAAATAAGQSETAAQAAAAAAAPTAGTQSSGIGRAAGGPATLRVGEGETRQVVRPDGSKKAVRIVAPTLGPDIVPQ